MMINRHNYEEFFLLYVDHELKADDRNRVEKFIGENPDLAKELESLQQATLAETEVSFDEKELLYRNEKRISLLNYEEYFLLSIDNELAQKQATELNAFLLDNEQLKAEYKLIKRTKSEPELISFTGKEILYRKEKQRRTIPLLIRMSTAAALAGLAVATWFIFNSASYQPKKLVATKQPAQIKQAQRPGIIQPKNTVVVLARAENKKPVKLSKAYSAFAGKGQANIAEGKKTLKKVETSVAENKVMIGAKEVRTRTAIPKAFEEPVAQQTTPEITTASTANESNSTTTDKKNENGFIARLVNEKNASHDALTSHAVYRILDTDDEEDKNLHIGNAEINKNKLKGLFKKAASFIEKKISRSQN